MSEEDSMKFRQIEIDEDVFEYLKRKAEPFIDTPNSVLRRELLNKETNRSLPAQAQSKIRINSNDFPIGTPIALQHILEVVRLVREGLYNRNEATSFIAKKYGIAPQTVQDKYGRQLGITASDFDRLLANPQLGDLVDLLIKKFPSHGSLIRNYLSE